MITGAGGVVDASSQIDRAAEILRRRGRVSLGALGLELGVTDQVLALIRRELVEVLELAEEAPTGVLTLRDGSGATASLAGRRGAERRQVTFLLCDVVSSLEMSTRLDPEDLRNLMLDYQRVCNQMIEHYGGHISQWIGDGVVVYFGYPEAHDDDTNRAVRAGLAIIEGVKGLTPASDGTRMQVRVGVHSGPVVVGDLGAGDGSETLAFGETPNMTARIQAAADVDSLFVSEQALALVSGFVETEDRGTFMLKGAANPTRLHRVVGLRAARDRFEAARNERGVTPMVGRANELARIGAAWEHARSGDASVVVLAGEPGIGKSRLIHAARDVVGSGGRVLEFHSSPYDRASPLYPVVVGLRAFWGLGQDASADLDLLSAEVARCRDLDPGVVVPWIAELLGVVAPLGPGEREFTPQRRRMMTIEALTSLVLSQADHAGPLLLVVEDMHWSDPTTNELLWSIRSRAAGHRILGVVAARPEYLSDPDALRAAAGGVPIVVVELEALSTTESADLARGVLGSALDGDLVERVAAAADGVPLFVEELALSFREGGASLGRDGGASIPVTLQSCLLARLDRLSPKARMLAQLGAAVGRTFDLDLARAAAPGALPGPGDVLVPLLEELQVAQLIRRVPPDAETFVFRHALIQETAAASVLRAESRSHHRAIAEALRLRPEARPEVVARHLAEGGDAVGSIECWREAGVEALRRSAVAEAIGDFESALSLVDSVPAGDHRDELELGLRVLYAVSLTLTRGFSDPSVGTAFRRGAVLCDRLGARPELFPTMSGLLTFDIVRADFASALARAEANLAVAVESGRAELIIVAEQDLGACLVYVGRERDALDHLGRPVALAEPGEHFEEFVVHYGRDPVVVAMLHQGMARFALGDHDGAVAATAAGAELGRRYPHPFTLLWAEVGLAWVHAFCGDLEAVELDISPLVERAREQGFPNWMSQAMIYEGWSGAARGDAEGGLARLLEGRRLWEETGSLLMSPCFDVLEAQVRLGAGDLATALVVAERGWQSCRPFADQWFASELKRVAGDVWRKGGDVAIASACYDEALAHATSLDLDGFTLRALISRAQLAEHPGHSAALRRLAAFLERFEYADANRDVPRAREILAR